MPQQRKEKERAEAARLRGQGLTHEQIARRFGVSRGRVSQWLEGHAEGEAREREQIAEARRANPAFQRDPIWGELTPPGSSRPKAERER